MWGCSSGNRHLATEPSGPARLTPTLTLRRQVINDKYADVLDAI
jgi:hypothetical protein